MTSKPFEEADNSTAFAAEVLSDDAQTRRVQLAFFERLVSHAAQACAAQLAAAKRPTDVENEVLSQLHRVRSRLWERLALELEGAHPAQADFGQFGNCREADH